METCWGPTPKASVMLPEGALGAIPGKSQKKQDCSVIQKQWRHSKTYVNIWHYISKHLHDFSL